MAKAVLTKELFDKIREKIIESTKRFATKNEYIRKALPKKLSKKNHKILHILNKNGFGCKQVHVTKIMGALVGFDFEKHTSEQTDTIHHWPTLAAVVPLVCHAGAHNYPLDKVSILTDSRRRAMRPPSGVGGGMGNYLPDHAARYVRPATAEEIAGITDAHIEEAVSEMDIMFV